MTFGCPASRSDQRYMLHHLWFLENRNDGRFANFPMCYKRSRIVRAEIRLLYHICLYTIAHNIYYGMVPCGVLQCEHYACQYVYWCDEASTIAVIGQWYTSSFSDCRSASLLFGSIQYDD
ncbi:hypothetical protein TNCV_3889471 [Trichonephila clavipes]|nr:hypothetical protein TNCV_3889471 [Trichonephila clavipes]